MDRRANEIISLLYEAVLDDSLWQAAITTLTKSLNAIGASYFVWNDHSHQADFWCAVGHDETLQQRYLAHYADIDPTRNAVINSRPGELLQAKLIFPESYINRSEYFQDYLLPAGIGDVIGGKAMDNNGVVGIFSVQKSSDANLFNTGDRALMAVVVPHLVRASKIHWKMRNFQRRASTLELALNKVNLPVFLVNNKRYIHFANCAAESLFKGKSGITQKDRFLSLNASQSESTLMRLLACATESTVRKTEGMQVITSCLNTFLTVIPVCQELSSDICQERLALIVASPSRPAPEEFKRVASGVFNLTLAEKRLAWQLQAGKTPAEAAEVLQLGKETVRSQLRSLFEKTGTNRQAQLVSVLQHLSYLLPVQT